MNVDMTQGLLAAVAAAAPSAPAGPEQAGDAGSSGGEGLSFRELLLQRQGRAARDGEEAPICGETPRPGELQQALAAALLMQLTGPVQVYADAAPAGPVPEAVAGLDQALPGADWGGRTALFTAQPAPEAGQPPQIRREAGAESLQNAPGAPAQAEVQEQPVQPVQAPERTAEPVLQERPPEARPAEQAPEEPGRAQARQDAAQGEAPLFPELEHIPVKVGQAPVLDTRQPELEQRLAGYPAEGYIAVLLPTLRVQGDIGEQVDGGFEHIELPAGSHPVEAVGRIASLHIEAEGLPFAVGTPLMGVPGDSRRVQSHKDDVVVGQVLIDKALPYKGCEHRTVDLPRPQQVAKHPPLISGGGWKCEGF